MSNDIITSASAEQGFALFRFFLTLMIFWRKIMKTKKPAKAKPWRTKLVKLSDAECKALSTPAMTVKQAWQRVKTTNLIG